MANNTVLLDTVAWDFVIDAASNIAVAGPPYSLAQDAASAIRTFLGECWYNITLGVPYYEEILGKSPPLSLVKAQFVDAALTVPGVVAAVVFFNAFTQRGLTGQVQITDDLGQTATASF